MLEYNYEGYGFDTVEQFVPLEVQCGFGYKYDKKKDIKHSEVESFFGEVYSKEAELTVKTPCCCNKPEIELIEHGEPINSERTEN